MKRIPRSKVISFRKSLVSTGSFLANIWKAVFRIWRVFERDRISVYAAQASFFMVISAFPFLMLAMSFCRSVIPQQTVQWILESLNGILPRELFSAANAVFGEVFRRPQLSMTSVSALTALWSASRGVNAIRQGVINVYTNGNIRSFLQKNGRVPFFFGEDILRSILYTLLFLLLIPACLLLFVAGGFLYEKLIALRIAAEAVLAAIYLMRIPFFVTLLSFSFCLLYKAAYPSMRRRLPGALFAAAGWLLFSYFYSLYIKYFPTASYLYGSLTAVVLLMLWLYFCMMLLLLGAELNKWEDHRRNLA